MARKLENKNARYFTMSGLLVENIIDSLENLVLNLKKNRRQK